MAIINKFNVNKQQVTLDADIIENMSANDVSYDASTQYDKNTVGEKLSELSQHGQQMIYDVTTNNNGATFASLSTLLSDENLSTLIPVSVRCGGMTIRFVQSSDNKYVQYRYMNTVTTGTPNPFLDTDNWTSGDGEFLTGEKVSEVGVDDVPTANSKSLVTSSGIKKALDLKADQDSVDSIETRLLPIENTTYSLLDGFNEIPSDGYGIGDSAVSFIIPTIYEKDTKISKVSLKRKVTDTTHAFKIASVIKNSSNQLIVNTLSDSIELPVVETNGIVNDFIVDYTIPANTQVALVFDIGSLLYTSSSATACLSNTVVTAFGNLTIGNRLANEGPYTSHAAISLYTSEVELKPLVTQAELDAEGVRLEGLIGAEKIARENADTEFKGSITSINNKFDELNELKEDAKIILNGFNEIPSGGFKDSSATVYYIFPTVYEQSTDVSLIKIKCSQSATVRKFKIASVFLNAKNEIIVQTVSEAIDIPIIENDGDIVQINVDFNIPSNQQVALIFENTSVAYNSEEATLCKKNSVVNAFSDIKKGSRLVTLYSTPHNYNDTISASLYYSGKQFKDFSTEEELTAAITECKNYSDSQIISSNKYLDAKRQLLNSVVVSKYKTELMAHGSLGIDGGDGYFYIIYYGSETQRPEGIASNCICRLSKVSQCNLYDSEVIDVLKKGENVANFIKGGSQVLGGFTQSSFYSPYDPNVLLVETTENTHAASYVRCFMTIADSSFTEGDTSAEKWEHVGIGYRDINRDTFTPSDTIVMSNLRYKEGDVIYDVPMTMAELSTMICRHFGTTDGKIGTYPIFTSKFVSYNGDIYGYLGGLNAKTGLRSTPPYDFAGVMLKSSDKGTTWEVVAWGNDVYSVFGPEELAMWEAAIDIIGSCVYVIFKSLYSYVAYYDLSNNTWSNLVPLLPYAGGALYVGQSSSRPHIYAKGNYLYAMVNVDPAMSTTWLNSVYRSRVHVMKIYADLSIVDEKELLNDGSCQYFSVINQRGREYLVFTEDKAHLGYIYDTGIGQWIFRGKSNISVCVLDIFN